MKDEEDQENGWDYERWEVVAALSKKMGSGWFRVRVYIMVAKIMHVSLKRVFLWLGRFWIPKTESNWETLGFPTCRPEHLSIKHGNWTKHSRVSLGGLFGVDFHVSCPSLVTPTWKLN